MAYCSACGAELAADADTCTECGTTVDGDDGALSGALDSATDAGTEEKIAYAGGALSVVGAFLPWASVLGVSVSGIEGDGVITLVLGLVAAGLVYAREWDRTTNIALTAIGVLIAVVGLSAMSRFAAVGVYVTIVGGLVVAYPGAKELVN